MYGLVPCGAQKVSGVTVESITNTTAYVIQHLLDIRSLPTKELNLTGPTQQGARSSNNNKGKRSNYGKKKK